METVVARKVLIRWRPKERARCLSLIDRVYVHLCDLCRPSTAVLQVQYIILAVAHLSVVPVPLSLHHQLHPIFHLTSFYVLEGKSQMALDPPLLPFRFPFPGLLG